MAENCKLHWMRTITVELLKNGDIVTTRKCAGCGKRGKWISYYDEHGVSIGVEQVEA